MARFSTTFPNRLRIARLTYRDKPSEMIKFVSLMGLEPVFHWLPDRMARRFSVSLQKRRKSSLRSCFFPDWYSREVVGMPSEMPSPLRHYLLNHAKQNNDPNPFFDSTYYRKKHMPSESTESALEHFLRVGVPNGLSPHPMWDGDAYIRWNPHLYSDLESLSAYQHFCAYGQDRVIEEATTLLALPMVGDGCFFRESLYLAANPDVQALVRSGKVSSGLEHFFRSGYRDVLAGDRRLQAESLKPRLLDDESIEVEAQARDLVIFAHYDRDGHLDPCVVEQLRSFKAHDFDIVFVTAQVREADKAVLRELCRRIIMKSAAGRDFGSWAVALEALGEGYCDDYQNVCWVNDSVYWPVVDPRDFFETMRQLSFDYWGVVDSRQHAYHVQSWFIGFNKRARQAVMWPFVERFMSLPDLPKFAQILEYEMGLCQKAMDSGLSVGAYCSIDDIREDLLANRSNTSADNLIGPLQANPSIDGALHLIRYYDCPALKVELLRDNPMGAPDVETWRNYVSDEMRPLIERSLNRLSSPAVSRNARIMSASAASKLEVRDRITGTGARSGRRMVLFAHYDPDRVLDPHVAATLKGLNAADSDVVLISGGLDDTSVAQAKSLASEIILKTDTARDFGSWYLAVRELSERFVAYDSVIWMNDSTYSPLFDLNEMLDKMEKFDFWGAVESKSIRWHVMSWFWSFSRKAIDEGFFRWYLGAFSESYSKWDQIKNYEMRVPLMLQKQGLRCGAYITIEDLVASGKLNGHPRYTGRDDFTMTHDFWDVIIKDFRCPALKVELLRDNPLGLPLGADFEHVVRLIGEHTDYDPSLILAHQARIRRRQL